MNKKENKIINELGLSAGYIEDFLNLHVGSKFSGVFAFDIVPVAKLAAANTFSWRQ